MRQSNYLKKLIALLSVFLLLSSLSVATAVEESDLVNVAIGKKVTASGHTHRMSAQALVDGIELTGWSSETANNTWAMIDLGRKMQIAEVHVVTRQDVDQAHTRNYFYVEVSNSPDFTEYVRVGEVGATALNFKDTLKCPVDGKYRYVRYRKYTGNYSFLGEIKIFVHKKDIPSDAPVDSEIYSQEAFLELLGIDTASLSAEITRAEAAKVLAGLLQFKATAADYYNDIKDEETLIAANALCQAGVLSPAANGKFNPSKVVSYQEAVKMVTSMLGYATRAEYKGGYPTGYLLCANEAKLLKNVNGAEFSKEDFIALVFNMLEAYVYESTTFREDSVSFVESDDTFLERYWDIKKVEGIVEETEAFTTYLQPMDVMENQIVVDGTAYYYDNEGAQASYSEYFAKKVNHYYKNNDGRLETFFMYPEPGQKELTVSLADFVSLTGTKLEYANENDDTKSYSLSNDYKILRNGSRVSSVGTLSTDGMIKLYDNDGDGQYDIVRIIETSTKILKAVKKQNNNFVLYFKDNTNSNTAFPNGIDPDLPSRIVYDNGDFGEVVDLKEDDIISWCSGNTRAFEAYIGNATIESKITAINDDEVTVDYTTDYPLADNAVDITSDILNQYGLIYLDYFGNVFTFDGDVKAKTGYGYMVGITPAKNLAGPKVKVFNEKGSFSVYEITDDTVVDGGTRADGYTWVSTVFNRLTGANTPDETDDKVGMVIKFTSNSYLELISLDTLEPGAGGNGDSLQALVDNSANTADKYYNLGVYDEKFLITDEALVFKIPANASQEEKFSVGGQSNFRNRGLYKQLMGYTANNDTNLPTLECVVIETLKPSFSDNPNIIIVDTVSQTSRDDEVIPMLHAYHNGVKKQFTINSDFTDPTSPDYIDLTQISKGDVIQVVFDAENQINNLSYIYNHGGTILYPKDAAHRALFQKAVGEQLDGSGVKPYGNGSYWGTEDITIYNTPALYGLVSVYSVDGDYVMVCPDTNIADPIGLAGADKSSTRYIIMSLAASRIMVYDSQKNSLTEGGISDIMGYKDDTARYSRIFFKAYSGNIYDVVVYR